MEVLRNHFVGSAYIPAGGQDEAHGHLVVGVEPPATEGRPERGATTRGKRPVPVQVRAGAGEHTRGQPGPAEAPSGPPRDVLAVDIAFLFQALPERSYHVGEGIR